MFDGGKINYETEEYRDLVDTDSSPGAFYKTHDSEQSARLAFFDISEFRGGVFVDVGAGAGSFLDLIKGYAASTVAIEPAASYHDELNRKGHQTYFYMSEALKHYSGKADVVTCFSVIEHIDDPVSFLTELTMFCRPGGTIVVSTPNTADWLINFLPDTYKPFYYRVVHKWYFKKESLEFIAKKVNLTNVEIKFKQRFNLTNTLNWIKHGKPTGRAEPMFSQLFESYYQHEMEDKGLADYLYMIAKK
jgi:2-polyprenyl-3-methyl-5-hydroxy-6-metoxy-1,4-benzoquinol methylase